jgi:hypothetical protein
VITKTTSAINMTLAKAPSAAARTDESALVDAKDEVRDGDSLLDWALSAVAAAVSGDVSEPH